MPADQFDLRAADVTDEPTRARLVALAASALGWAPGEPNEELFHWKHVANPFGASPVWVAERGGELAAVRVLMRWRFEHPDHGTVAAVRAVDTATAPAHQGQGLFTALTRMAIRDLRGSDVRFIFNTPNDQSRPGYLKMGWQDVGRVPVVIRPRGVSALPRIAAARAPAAKWSLDRSVGEEAADVLADSAAVDALLASQPSPTGWRTERSADHLRWRYAGGPIRYRALARTSRVEDGFVLFRCRERGRAVEVTVADVLVPGAAPALRTDLLRALARARVGDYLIMVDHAPVGRSGVRLPGQGPRLTFRTLDEAIAVPPLDTWHLVLGDIELF